MTTEKPSKAVAPSRRIILSGLAAAPLLGGCAEIIEDIADSCPSDPAASGDVTWIPDVAHPVFWGVHNITAADGAPRAMDVYYPAAKYDAPPVPVLEVCLGRWPVVLFLHGQPPQGIPTSGYHEKWWLLPMTLARCGYVVIVPNHEAQLPTATASAAMVDAAMQDIDWVRTQWSGSARVSTAPTFTVAGHSYGALLAARVAGARPDQVAALVSLSGPYTDLANEVTQALDAIRAPTFFMWSADGALEDLDSGGLWRRAGAPKWSAEYGGGHFDYLDPQVIGDLAGPCPYIRDVAADLAALFVAANVQSLTQVPIDLTPPQVQLTPTQASYAVGYQFSFDRVRATRGCRVDLKWDVNGVTGSRVIGA